MNVSGQILQNREAQASDKYFEEQVTEYRKSMLACASRTMKHFVTEQDEEWSVTLQAFYEAVQSYEAARGEFWPYASVIIRRRLTDYMRGLYRHREEDQAEIPETIQAADNWPGEYTIADEIEAVQGEFTAYGFSFFDLTEASPKSEKTRKKCANAVAALLQDAEMIRVLETTKTLPVKRLVCRSRISAKTLERHRRYIIAAVLILRGDYPLLAEYLHMVREEMKS